MKLKTMLLLFVVGLLAIAGVAHAQDDAANDPILQEASTKFADASFNYTLNMSADLDGADLDLDGTGAVQAPVSGFLGMGTKSRGLSLNVRGDLESLPIDIGTVALGDSMYMRGLIDDEWVQAPTGVFAGGAAVNPAAVDDNFMSITREADDAIDGQVMAVFAFDYDFKQPAAQDLITRTTAGMDSMGGFIATGSQAAQRFAESDLTMVQYINMSTMEVRRIVIDFDLGTTRLDIQIDIPEGYTNNVTITAPADARPLTEAIAE